MSEQTALARELHQAAARLPLPSSVRKDKILWPYFVGIIGVHLLALLALVPWLFSWTGMALALAGLYVFGTLGINLCYHRLLTHKGFILPKWLEHTFAVIGVCCLQDTPARWVAVHRLHHQNSDDQEDPHSPLVSFFWSHFGWLMVTNQELQRLSMYERYSRDILRDRFYLNMERHGMWIWINVVHWLGFFLSGLAAGWALSGEYMGGVQFGLSLLVWGVFVRTVLVWHITWSVNSVTHLWGYRNYETDERSRNNIVVGLLSNGEGWHNNHHADPRSAAHGHRWWELDVTYLTIKALALVGLASAVTRPNPRIAARHGGPLITRDVQDMGE
jgi:fatty-acid desaturase